MQLKLQRRPKQSHRKIRRTGQIARRPILRNFAIAAALAIASAGTSAGCDSGDDRPASFSYLYATVIEPNCSTIGCHSSLVRTYGLQLDSHDSAYAVLVGAPCDEMGGAPVDPLQTFVQPGHPDRSRLLHLLDGDNVRLRMPPDSPLPQKDIDLMRQWILEGALCN